MPKLKSNRGAAKRFKITKHNKVKLARSNRRHLLECKSTKRIRQGRRSTYVHAADKRAVRQLLPYAF